MCGNPLATDGVPSLWQRESDAELRCFLSRKTEQAISYQSVSVLGKLEDQVQQKSNYYNLHFRNAMDVTPKMTTWLWDR